VKFILVCVIVLALSQTAWAQRAGTITQLTGTAQLLRAGVANNVTLTMPVDVHDRLTTATDSTLTLTLIDNSTLSAAEVYPGYETTVPCLLPPLNGGPIGIPGAAGRHVRHRAHSM